MKEVLENILNIIGLVIVSGVLFLILSGAVLDLAKGV